MGISQCTAGVGKGTTGKIKAKRTTQSESKGFPERLIAVHGHYDAGTPRRKIKEKNTRANA